MVERDLMRKGALMLFRLKLLSSLITIMNLLCLMTFAPSIYLMYSRGSWGYLVASFAITLFALKNGDIVWKALCKDADKILTEMEAEQWHR